MNDFFNSLGNSLYDKLCNIDMSLHKNNKANTFIDSFIHELRDFLFKEDAIYKLSKMPKETMFDINEIEKNYVQCYFNSEEFPIPKDMICIAELNGADDGFSKLQLQDDGLYHVIKVK